MSTNVYSGSEIRDIHFPNAVVLPNNVSMYLYEGVPQNLGNVLYSVGLTRTKSHYISVRFSAEKVTSVYVPKSMISDADTDVEELTLVLQ